MREDSPDRYCKKCGADFLDKEIPLEHREHYGDSTHFSRRMAFYDQDLDRTTSYGCPDCGNKEYRP